MISKESLNEFHPGCISRRADYCFRKEDKHPPIPQIGIARGSKDVGLEIIYKNERAAGEEYARSCIRLGSFASSSTRRKRNSRPIYPALYLVVMLRPSISHS